MATTSIVKGMEASIKPTLEQQSSIGCQQMSQGNVLRKGQDMEQLMVELTASIQAISEEMDESEYSVKKCKDFIDKVQGLKCKLNISHAEWLRLYGPSADTAVGSEVTNLNSKATKLINLLRKKMGGDKLKTDTNTTEAFTEKFKNTEHSNVDSSSELGLASADCEKAEKTIPSKNVESIHNETQGTAPSSYADLLAVVKPADKNHSSEASSSKQGKKSSARTGIKSVSKAGTKASTTGSAAARLQLMLEEAETGVDEEFHRELSARDQRKFNRDCKKAKEQKEKQERERIREFERQEQERVRELERQEQERVRELERQEQERLRDMERRDEERRREEERQEEALEMERERIQDESEEREALLQRKKDSIRARRRAIDRFEEINGGFGAGNKTEAESSFSSLPSEATAAEKVAAFIVKLPSVQDQKSGREEVKRTEINSGRADVDELISHSRSIINESKALLNKNKVIMNGVERTLTPGAIMGKDTVDKVDKSGPSTLHKVIVSESKTVISPDLFKVDKVTDLKSTKTINQQSGEFLTNRDRSILKKNENSSFNEVSNQVQGRGVVSKDGILYLPHESGHQSAFASIENQKKSLASTPPTWAYPQITPNCPTSEVYPLVKENIMHQSMNSHNYYAKSATNSQYTRSDQRVSSLPVVNPPVVVDKKASEYQVSTPVLNKNTSNLPTEYAYVATSPEQSEIRHSAAGRDNCHQLHPDHADFSSGSGALEAVCGQLALTRLPISEPDIFDGKDPLSFPIWRLSFDALISHRAITDIDKLNLLNKYLSGEAKKAVRGFLMLPPSEAYNAAYGLLLNRYGDNFKLASAFQDRLRSWSRIGATDVTGLRNFIDFLNQCRTAKRSFSALKILDDESENTALTKKLPVWLARQWARKVSAYRESTGEYPPFSDFVDFLVQEDTVANDPLSRELQKAESAKERVRGGSFAAEVNMKPDGRSFGLCLYCNERHSLDMCKRFGSESFELRQRFVREKRLCFGCLNRGHIARECKDRKFCQFCRGGHPTSLHRDNLTFGSEPSTMSVTACASKNNLIKTPCKSAMVVPTYISHRSNPDKEVLVYSMIDSQSDCSFVTESTAEALGLEGREIHLSLSTMTANNKVVKCNRFSGLEVRGYGSKLKIALPNLYSRKTIPINRQHIPNSDMIDGWPHLEPLRNILVPTLNCEVGLLIGYDCPKALHPREVLGATEDGDGPFGQRTDLGWSIVGVISQATSCEIDPIGYSHRIIASQVTGSQITLQKRSKEIVSPADCLRLLESDFSDRICKNESTSTDERKFLKLMKEGIRVDSSEHYSMPLPFNKRKEGLFNNRQLVVNRAMSLRRKMVRNSGYKEEYCQFMEDMIKRGYAEEVGESSNNMWYIPHFGVYHKTKGKLRVVFDCAAKYDGISLNDTLLKGPDYLNSLVGILCRFRRFPIAFSCDVEKMFYNFNVHPEDRDYLRFLWWKGGDVNQPLSTYRMTVHLFGAVSSPACASFGLRRIIEDFPECGNDVQKFVNRDFYVDDGLKSVETEDEAIDLVRRTVEVCRRRGIRLHKFTSNSEVLLKSIPESECAAKNNLLTLDLNEYPTERVLGMIWNIKSDSFQYRVNLDKTPNTRRGILSVTSSIFDPVGWIAPFTLRAKMILQQLCKENPDWDDKVPEVILRCWVAWYQEAGTLHKLSLQRCFQPDYPLSEARTQLHHFSDASEKGYGACSYLRILGTSGQISVHLVMAKSRVSPIASITIPRLELMAAVIAARLSKSLETELRLTNTQHFYWTDSQIVLGYLRNEAKRFKTFVANRVQEIQDISGASQWRHIAGSENPADLASRGMEAENLINSRLWYHGPRFLEQNVIEFEKCEIESIDPDDQEIRKVVCNHLTADDSLDVFNFNLFSSWKSLSRGIARAKQIAKLFKDSLSIKSRLRSADDRNVLKPLTVADYQGAELLIVQAIQQAYYQEEIECIHSKEVLSKNSVLYSLNCFMDTDRVLRVGGRLKFTNLYSVYKSPIVLPREAYVSELLVRDCHQAIFHQGRGMTINEVRARGFWVIGLNGIVKKLIRNCVTCRALRGNPVTQKMADLPPERADCMPPFTYCGVDFFGPFLVKERRSEVKRYGAIFTCLTTRAVHIEMAYSLTSDSFIQSLRKFIAIRGPVQLLRCDNGTNFVGANKELSKATDSIQSAELKAFVIKNNCDLEFRMNPPGASHMGGAWERLIGVVRSVLNAILDQHSSRLDDNSLSTFLYEVAAVINSRPLSLEHVTDPCHPEPLTPNHLLTGKSRVVVPPPGEFCQNDVYSVKRWRCVQALTDFFWQRWRKEYLRYLQLRSKWQRKEREMRVGDVVLLMDANTPRNDWRKGVVSEVIVSRDGFVRTVKLKTGQKEDGAETTLTRSVHKLILLLPSEGDTK